jgi:hypothetical protein
MVLSEPDGDWRRPQIFLNHETPLSSAPFHSDSPAVRRLAPTGFPLHVAVHEIAVEGPTGNYVEPHHHSVAEVNVLVPASSDFAFEITMDGVTTVVEHSASIWIPAGTTHAGQAVRGRGILLCLQVPSP